MKQILVIALCGALGLLLAGCHSGGSDAAVDAPLMKNAPPPPPRPNKPNISPTGAGGGVAPPEAGKSAP